MFHNLSLLDMCEIQRYLARALEILITRYQSITHYCAHNKMTAHHQRKDEVVLVYVRFLRWHSHSEEVGTMIRGLWFEC